MSATFVHRNGVAAARKEKAKGPPGEKPGANPGRQPVGQDVIEAAMKIPKNEARKGGVTRKSFDQRFGHLGGYVA